jgi:hypothetical protein
MKVDTALGPDGFPVFFFKKLCGIYESPILQLLNDFDLGRVDVSRLNFGVISLIPKVKGTDSMKQFMPIDLNNVIFNFIAKAYANRLASLAHRTIDQNQPAFVKGQAPQINHKLRTKKFGGLFLKLDFEKVYDRVNWDFLREVLTR